MRITGGSGSPSGFRGGVALGKMAVFLVSPGLLAGGTLFLLLTIYAVLPVAGSGPGSLDAGTIARYRAAAARVNPPVVSCYRFERSHLLDWSLLYALDFYAAQVKGKSSPVFDAPEVGRELAPRFTYRVSPVTVTSEGDRGRIITRTTWVKLLTRADTFRGIYVYRYKWATTKRTAANGTVSVTTREVPAGVAYTADWRRFDAVLERELGPGTDTSGDRAMVLAAAAAFGGRRSSLTWLAAGTGAAPAAGPVPAAYLQYFKAAAAKYGVPWNVLAAVAEVESDFEPWAVGPPNYTGELAQGMMQILPSTWARYAVKAYGSGRPDPFDAADSIFTAAHLLAADGATRNLAGALYLYNHSDSYVREVLSLAGRLAAEQGGRL